MMIGIGIPISHSRMAPMSVSLKPVVPAKRAGATDVPGGRSGQTTLNR